MGRDHPLAMDKPEVQSQKPKVSSHFTFGFWLLASGLLLGALLRFAALPLPGTGDVPFLEAWSLGAAKDLTGIYGVGGWPPEVRQLSWQGFESWVQYPPVAVAELGVAGRLYTWRRPTPADSPSFVAALKLPGLAAEAALVVVVLTWGRRFWGKIGRAHV